MAGSRFVSLPTEAPLPPVSNAHLPLCQGQSRTNAVRVAFIPADKTRGFLHFRVGDELHCGLAKSDGCVVSYSPPSMKGSREGHVRFERSSSSSGIWNQAIIVSDLGGIPTDIEVWDQGVDAAAVMASKGVADGFDCLEFVMYVMKHVVKVELTREGLSEIMCRQLYHVLKYAEIQRTVDNYNLEHSS